MSGFAGDHFFFFFFSANRPAIQWKSHRLWYWWINERINNFHTSFLTTVNGQRSTLTCQAQKCECFNRVPQVSHYSLIYVFYRSGFQSFSIDSREPGLVSKLTCKMADEESEFERPRKIPRTLQEKDNGKRLIVILENASLETVKVCQ